MRLSKYIDHTLLKADASLEAIGKLCDEAREYDFKSVCVNTCNIEFCKKRLEGSDVLVCCVIGAYCNKFTSFDVHCVFIFGVIGVLFKFLKIPATPLIIGFILGSMTETNFRQALMQTGGSWSIFVTRPISLIFLLVAVFSVAMTIRKQIVNTKKGKVAAEEEES